MTEENEGQLPEQEVPESATPESAPASEPMSLEELTQRFNKAEAERRELEKKLGEQGSELGKTREKAGYYESEFAKLQSSLVQGMQNQSMWGQVNNPYQQANPQKQEIDYDAFVENPVGAIDKILEQKLSALTAKQQQEQARQVAEQARINFQEGFKNAVRERPDLLGGVEDTVKSTVWNAFQAGKISPHDMRNTENWHTFAFAIKGKQKGYKFDSSPNPVEPSATVSPSQTRQQVSSHPNMSPTDRAMIEMMSRGAKIKFDEKALAESMKSGGK